MNNSGRQNHLPERFAGAGLAFAATAGFGYGASLILARVIGIPPGGWYSTLVQVHGHAQLFGFVGLFVLGTGLYFLPRLRGVSLQKPEWALYALVLLAAGITLRGLVQPGIGLWGISLPGRILFLFSALLELAGVLIVVWMLVVTVRLGKPLSPGDPAYAVEPLVGGAFSSLVAALVLNGLGVGNAVAESKSLVAARYDQLTILLMVYGTVVPMTFVFAVRTLPLFLRLVPPRREVWRTLALVYYVALTLRLVPYLLAVADDAVLLSGRLLRANFVNLLVSDALGVVGTLALNACLLLGVVSLQLGRRRGPRPDHGEYGRFDLLIYSAYVWLVIASGMDFLRALPGLNEAVYIPQDAARHAMTLGFITLLIFGMGVRLLPGFSGKRGVAYPQLVVWLAVLGNLAAVLRTIPLFFGAAEWVLPVIGVSGIVGWAAILLFTFEMWTTWHASSALAVPPARL